MNEETNKDDLAAKSALAAWIRGGIGLRAIVGAGAAGGRSTGGRRTRRCARSGHRNTWDATAARTARRSP